MEHICENNIVEHKPGGLLYCRICGKQFTVRDGVVVMPSADRNSFYHHLARYILKKNGR